MKLQHEKMYSIKESSHRGYLLGVILAGDEHLAVVQLLHPFWSDDRKTFITRMVVAVDNLEEWIK